MAYVVYNLSKQSQTEFKILKYRLMVPEGRAAIELLTEVNNSSALPLKVSEINLNVYINNTLIGTISPGKIYTIPPNKRARLGLLLNLTGGGAELIRVITNLQNLGKAIQVKGTIKAQGINMNINTNIQP